MAKKNNIYHVRIKITATAKDPKVKFKPAYHYGVVEAKTPESAKLGAIEFLKPFNDSIYARQLEVESVEQTVMSVKKIRADFVTGEKS